MAERASPAASAVPVSVVAAVPEARRPGWLGRLLEREHVLAGVLLAPALVILTVFIAYPFVLGIWLAVSDKVVGRPGAFVGLENFRVNLNDAIFIRAFRSEERRVGKECRSRWSQYHYRNNEESSSESENID